MFLKKKTVKRELICENILNFMNIEYERKNPCSYLIKKDGKDIMMLFVGKAGIKVKKIRGMSFKAIEDFKSKFEQSFNALNGINTI